MAKKHNRKRVTYTREQDDSNLKFVMGTVGVLLIVLVVLFTYSKSTGNTDSTVSNGTQQQNIASFQQKVQTAEKNAQSNPKDYNALKSLGDAYYDLGFAYLQNSKDSEATETYSKAIEPYQKALDIKFEINVQTDMATSSFYGNKFDIADTAFKKAIEKDPNFTSARLNYGIFLKEAMADKEGAKTQFEYVINKSKDQSAVSKAKQLLSGL